MNLRFITPLVHPASVMRGRPALAPVQVAYLRRLAADPCAEPEDINKAPRNCEPDPSLATLRWFADLVRTGRPEFVVLDIENAGPHLVCCGMLRLHLTADGGPGEPDRGVCFRFRHAGGAPWWPTWEEHLEAVTLLDSILADPLVSLVGHFIIQHDLPLLTELGFEVRGPLLDTSALCHATHSELRKGLQFLATAFCGAPAWKSIKDEKDADDREADGEEDTL